MDHIQDWILLLLHGPIDVQGNCGESLVSSLIHMDGQAIHAEMILCQQGLHRWTMDLGGAPWQGICIIV